VRGEQGKRGFVTENRLGHVTRLECAHHDEVTFGDELRVGAFPAPVEARVQLPFAQAERVERGVARARGRSDVQ